MADIFAEQGIWLTRTSNDRLAGWMAVRERLRPVEDETGAVSAGLCVFENCVNLIRTLPLLRYDERRPSDAARDPHEITHAPDALRGFCVYWVQQGKEEAAPPRGEKLIHRLTRRGRRRY